MRFFPVEADGQTLVLLLDPGESLRGEFSTLSTSDWPSVGGGCSSLVQTLETGCIPARYFLSRKACAGILRRAERRGKTLPEQLARALKTVADSAQTST
jgi:hypothetical protein